MKIFIGVDPGKNGAVAAISGDGSATLVWDYEHAWEMIDFISDIKVPGERCRACIEKVHAMPQQGVTSMFTFGKSAGYWEGVFDSFNIRYDFVTTGKWRKIVLDSAKKGIEKEVLLNRARRLFPDAKDRLTRKKDHSRAEALLIAEYCRRVYG